MGANPFKSQWAFSSPLPFVDFLFTDYSAEIAVIDRAFDEYRRDGPGFLAAMKADICAKWDAPPAAVGATGKQSVKRD